MSLMWIFLISFASSTILPLSSEGVVIGAILLGENALYVFLLASAGNVLGGATTYFLGYFGLTKIIHRYIKPDMTKLKKIQAKLESSTKKLGLLLAFLSFVPIVGDIFMLAIGMARFNPILSMAFMAFGKMLRYWMIILPMI